LTTTERDAAEGEIQKLLAEDKDGSVLAAALSLFSDPDMKDIILFRFADVVGVHVKQFNPKTLPGTLEGLKNVPGALLMRKIFSRILEPLYFKAPELFDPETLRELVKAYEADVPEVKYLLFYASLQKTGPPLFTKQQFPSHEAAKMQLGSGPKKVLFVYGISDGIGDQLIMDSTLLGALLASNPDLTIDIHSRRPYLYAHPRIHTYEGSGKESYDLVIYARGASGDRRVAEAIVRSHLATSPGAWYVELNKNPMRDKPLASDHKRIVYTHLDQNRYVAGAHIAAELGLPFHYGTEKSAREVHVGIPYEPGDAYWAQEVKPVNRDGRPVVAFNPFGGELSSKGAGAGVYQARFETILKTLVENKLFVLMFPNDTWGTVESAKALRNSLPEELQRYVQIGPSPKADPLLPKYLVDRCDAVVAVEGGMSHLAYHLGKPLIVILTDASGDPNEWLPFTADRLQGASGSRGADANASLQDRRAITELADGLRRAQGSSVQAGGVADGRAIAAGLGLWLWAAESIASENSEPSFWDGSGPGLVLLGILVPGVIAFGLWVWRNRKSFNGSAERIWRRKICGWNL